ncbi:MAG: hypothetical protein GY774_35475 [Planctomycetes bacterium]|nr:hypothetical protein [Planctomycetota bacterium]
MQEPAKAETTIPFSDVTKLAHKLAAKKKCYISVQIDYAIFRGKGEIKYRIWDEHAGWSMSYKMVQDLMKFIRSEINNPNHKDKDKGVAV